MSDSDLWGPGGEPGGGDDGSGSRVDELFTTAIERQVAEQRNLNRLLTEVEQTMVGLRGRIDELQKQVARDVAPTADRLGALEATLRSLRETQSQQNVALRAELQEAVDAFRGDAEERSRQLTAELEDVRRTDAALGDRVTDVSSTVTTALAGLDARQDNVASELSRLAAELGEAVGAAAAARDAVGPVAGRLEGIAPDVEAAVARTLEDRLGSVVAELRARADEDRETVRSELADLREGLLRSVREVAAEEAEGQRARIDETLERRLAEAEDRTTAQGARTTAELREVADEVGGQLHQLRGTIDERLGSIAADLRASVRDELAATTESLAGQLSAAAAEVRSATEVQGDLLDERTRVLRDELTRQLGELRDAGVEQRDRVDQAVAALEAAHREATGALGSDVRAQLDSVRDGLDSRVSAVLSQLAEQGRELTERVGEHAAGSREEQREALAAMRTEQQASLDTLGGGLRDALTAVQDEVRAHRAVLAEQAGALEDGLAAARETLRAEVAGIEATLAGAEQERTVALDDRFARWRDATEARMSENAAMQRAAADDALTALRSGLEGIRAHLVGERQATERALAEQRDAVAEQVTRAADSITEQRRLVEDQRRSAEEQAQRLATLADELRDRIDERLGGVDRHLVEQLEGQRAEILRLQMDERARLRDELDGHREIVESSLARHQDVVDGLAAGLRALATSLTDELAEVSGLGAALGRDRELEREARSAFRAELVTDLSGRLDDALSRFRDEVGTRVDALAGAVDDSVGGQADRVAATLAEVRAGLDAAVAERSDDLAATVERTRTALTEAAAEQTERFGALADELRTDVERSLVDGADRIRQSVSQGDARLRDLATTVTEALSAVAGTSDALSGAVEAVEAELRKAQDERLDRLAREQSEVLGELSSAQATQLEGYGKRLERAAASVTDRGEALEDRLAKALEELTARTRTEIDAANERLVSAVGRVDALADHLDRMERSLVGYLEARDERLERERALLLRDLVEQLSDGLSKRERKKLAAKLEVPTTPATPAPVTPATPAAPGPATPPAEVAADVPPPASADEPPAAPPEAGPAPVDVETPATGTPAAAPAPAAPAEKKATRSSPPRKVAVKSAPPRKRTSRAPARTADPSPRDVLGGVKGVGPAKQSALIDAFGTVAAMRAASLEELAAVKGIGDSLAEAIKAALEG